MIDHYKVLDVSRMATTEDIKNKTKVLIKQVKNEKLNSHEKNTLLKKIYQSYQFLKDYHNRRSLDEYLDSNYKIIYPEEENKNNKQEFTMMPFSFCARNDATI